MSNQPTQFVKREIAIVLLQGTAGWMVTVLGSLVVKVNCERAQMHHGFMGRNGTVSSATSYKLNSAQRERERERHSLHRCSSQPKSHEVGTAKPCIELACSQSAFSIRCACEGECYVLSYEICPERTVDSFCAWPKSHQNVAQVSRPEAPGASAQWRDCGAISCKELCRPVMGMDGTKIPKTS